jgi:hypothetical protein
LLSRSVLLLGLVAVVCLLVFGSGGAAAGPSRDCGNWSAKAAYEIRAKNVSCEKARSVIRRWGATAAREPGGDGEVYGFYCNYRNLGYEAGAIRCSAPQRKLISWKTGV